MPLVRSYIHDVCFKRIDASNKSTGVSLNMVVLLILEIQTCEISHTSPDILLQDLINWNF